MVVKRYDGAKLAIPENTVPRHSPHGRRMASLASKRRVLPPKTRLLLLKLLKTVHLQAQRDPP